MEGPPMTLANQRILITGASGFLGRHLVTRLWRVAARTLTKPRRAEFDLTREADVVRLMAAAKPDLVFHLAARVGGIGANRAQPGTFAYENLIMGARLIEECRRVGVRKFVLAGTICAYPKHTPAPFKEPDLWNGYPEETNAPYGLAKKMLLVQLQAYRQEFGFRSACLLLANLYGPGDHTDLETSHRIPPPTREFRYVEDAARALQLAAERIDEPEPINVGTGQETSIAELARMIADQVGYRGELRFGP